MTYKISSPQNQLRQNRSLLLLIGGNCCFFGLLLWSLMPFALNNPKDKVGVTIRFVALFVTLSAGVAAVASGRQLDRVAPLLSAIDTAEKNAFLDELAVSQYVQQQQFQKVALQPPTPVMASVTQDCNAPERNRVTDAVSMVPTVTDKPVTTATQDTITPVKPEDIEGYKPLYLSCITHQQQGMSESVIIKDILGFTGRNYDEGKQIYQTLMQLGRQQEW